MPSNICIVCNKNSSTKSWHEMHAILLCDQCYETASAKYILDMIADGKIEPILWLAAHYSNSDNTKELAMLSYRQGIAKGKELLAQKYD